MAHLIWDPSPEMFHFNLPLLGRPLLWYGFLFAAGFFAAYGVLFYLLRRYFSTSKESSSFAEKLSFYVMIGAIVGARLGDLLFYQDWKSVIRDPLSLIAIWEGGLASHGGAIGILIALLIFSKRYKIAFLRVLDFTVIPTALAAVFIRIGNFMNQEILGTATNLPWGIIFLHPADKAAIVPRHPVQLYEAGLYLCIFFILLGDWHRRPAFKRVGWTAGLFLVLVFVARFCVEFVKVEQSVYIKAGSLLTMGQWLSLPFIALGICLLYVSKKRSA
jgi:phosphatidylglycerol:prolipoprotein diacylglycerol transferase